MKNASNKLKNKHLIVKLITTGEEANVTAIARDPSTKIKNNAMLSDPHSGDLVTTFTRGSVSQLSYDGKIPKELASELIAIFDDHDQVVQLSQQQRKIREQEKAIACMAQLERLLQKDPSSQLNAIRYLLSMQESYNTNFSFSEIPATFFKQIDTERCFGVVKVLADRLKYIPELLDQSEVVALTKEGPNRYMIRSSKRLKEGNEIQLNYSFTLSKGHDLTAVFKKYLSDMREALKTLLAYWACANEMKSFKYFAPITTIMSVMKPESRKSSWSSSEKRRFWELSKLLEDTKLIFKFKVPNANEWIDFKAPFLDLSITASSSKNQEIKNGYPDKVIPQVLNPILKDTAYHATEISKGTLLLRPEDIILALYPQIRSSQNRKANSTELDESYTMSLAGLSNTYKSNPRMARKKLNEKIERIEKANSIAEGKIEKNGKTRLTFRRQKSKSKT